MSDLLIAATWFGITAGLIEGIGLLCFQRINWENWGRALHVSLPIVWISPGVDVVLFLAIALGCLLVTRIWPRLPTLRCAVFLLTAATVYDWLALTDRLYHTACALLAIGVATAFQRWFSNHENTALRFWKKTLPWAAALVMLVFIGIEGGEWWRERSATANLPAAAPGSPNVLVVIFDALRADHVSSYGYARPTTPEIDRLAAGGVLFQNAIAASSWSLPSHASLVTGRYQFEHGAKSFKPVPLRRRAHPSFRGYPMLGEALASHGYRTGAFSGNRAFFTQNDGFGRGFQHFEDFFQSPEDAILRTLYGREFMRLYLSRNDRFVLHKQADVVNRELLDWIDRDRQRPFMAYLNYFDVHDPYGGPDSYPKPSWELKTPADEYDAGLKYDDDYLGRLLGELERRGMAQNTIVVITSDHGESLGQHGLLTHSRALYWELLHVPLVISYPGHVPAGERIVCPVTNAAIPATVMDLVDASAQNEFPGPPLTTLWKNPGAAENWPAPLSEIARNPYPEKEEKLADQMEPTSTTGSMTSIVTPQWHLITHENLGDQIYDWTKDPGEKNNLISTSDGRMAAHNLISSLPAGVANSLAPRQLERLASATLLQKGTFDFKPLAHSSAPEGVVNEFYRIDASPGSKVTIQVRAQRLKTGSRLDPVLAIQDSQLKLLDSCRNPGDDHLGPPGVADKTPDSFDDLCMNDDIRPGSQTDSQLELLTPAASTSPVKLYVHVMEWNLLIRGRKHYQIVVDGVLQQLGAVTKSGLASHAPIP